MGYSPWSFKSVRHDLATKSQQQISGMGWASELPTKVWKALFCKGSHSRYLESFPFILPVSASAVLPYDLVSISSAWAAKRNSRLFSFLFIVGKST